MRFTVRRNRWYEADITLTGLAKRASNARVASEFMRAGFSNVTVWGTGQYRKAKGQWRKADTTAAVPSQVKSVRELPT